MYQEHAALSVPGAVVWTQQVTSSAPARVLPDGCMDVIWKDGELSVSGPDTTALLVAGRIGESYAGLRFAPGTAAAVLGLPAWELRDRRVPLDQLWPGRQVRELAERVSEAEHRGTALESLVLPLPAAPDPVGAAVLSGLRRGLRVEQLAQEAALSERQLRRRCLDLFGYGPKTLARVLRLQRALGPARTGIPFVQVAADAGYADQAHLAREVRALTGVPLGRLLAGEG
ncbi:helix-turn-helix transcriptional regulator [Streptacidiphilus albus]|uniref:helix-turn-helix transcriptional regulator n=1 Tax=Streptacidiphilus albus TaxID=105425 RepID=UPI00054B4C79|nr:helix-turn-helix transcriptional regulator [Streptacidiphilus albus]